MTVPAWQHLLLPVLRAGSNGAIRPREAAGLVAHELKLSAEDRSAELRKGRNIVQYRVEWAVSYLCRAKLAHRPERGQYEATADGLEWLITDDELTLADLKARPAYHEHQPQIREQQPDQQSDAISEESSATPEERMVGAARDAVETLKSDLMDQLLGSDPAKLEQVVIDLMLAMGYGGGGSAERVGKTADGGIDGIINEDDLGLEVIYLQAKRYAVDNVIGVEKIREFAGALDEKRATKGVFVTTSKFSQPALECAENSSKRIILIDGEALATKMIDHEVGVRTYQSYSLKKIDAEYF